ncbi:MAG: coproporphyrinogen III oxidase, partial [Planctomycetaceae bacterium]|nr:coproporphyrinogen III oxidase [Planctomycetaceae bacterium]
NDAEKNAESALATQLPEVRTPLESDDHGSANPADDDKTEAGNYFVANYPPFSFWKPELKPSVEEVLERPAPEDTKLGVYFHIPFCRKRCHFCYFRVYTDKNAGEINAYIQAGLKEFEMYSKKPYLAGRKPQFVYFGGGTPSYLSVQQLQDLTGRMKDLFPWDETEEVAFEAEPGTLTEKKLEAIREIGVTRLSLGV